MIACCLGAGLSRRLAAVLRRVGIAAQVDTARTATVATRPSPTSRDVAAQFLRFLLVGGTATAIHYGLLILLHEKFGWPLVFATSIGFTISALFNFTASYFFTFRSAAPITRSAGRYLMVSGTGLLLNTSIFWLLNQYLNSHYMVAQVLATGTVLLWNFTLGRLFTFAGSRLRSD